MPLPLFDDDDDATAAPEALCPECGGALVIDQTAETENVWWVQLPARMPYTELRRRRAVVAFCMSCEFAIEIRR